MFVSQVGKFLEPEEYQKQIVPCVVKMFNITDRQTRVKLLQQMNLYIEHIPVATVNDQLFPSIAMGFNDTNPLVRETTIKVSDIRVNQVVGWCWYNRQYIQPLPLDIRWWYVKLVSLKLKRIKTDEKEPVLRRVQNVNTVVVAVFTLRKWWLHPTIPNLHHQSW